MQWRLFVDPQSLRRRLGPLVWHLHGLPPCGLGLMLPCAMPLLLRILLAGTCWAGPEGEIAS